MTRSAEPRVLFDSEELRRALGTERAPNVAGPRSYTSVSTDSRTLGAGALFVALPGERREGAEFLAEAARRGAVGAVVPPGREAPELDLEWFPSPEPLRVLGDLAAWHRQRSRARVVGITGSSGKTTVKEMVAAVLSQGRRVHRTAGNRNSLVGLPLTIFEAPPEADAWVLELGASLPGEIARLTAIASPDDAVVTSVGPAHLEAFESERRVLREKLALVEGAAADGAVVVGERPADLVREARLLRPDTRVAGLASGADYRPERFGVEAEGVWFERDGTVYRVPAGGEHHLRDALIAAALGEALGAPPGEIAAGLAAFRPLGMRSSLRRYGSLIVLADCYNANPESFGAAIEYLRTAFPDRRLAAVVGTMLEMGEHEETAHREVLEHLVGAGFDLIAATGAFEEVIPSRPGSRNGTRFLAAGDAEEIWEDLIASLEGDEVLLVKGSRGVRLERIVERLEALFGEREEEASPGPAEPAGRAERPRGE
ncbi:MAG: UDP-N-acetylmuramoyl-tripeptide--D-alanyl-D-alanine ligase [Gemmatimonadota bacterium]